jgi:threonine/homoserine/homoserine lactone efflux protein
VLFLALLPQFTDPSMAWPLAAQIVVLGSSCWTGLE